MLKQFLLICCLCGILPLSAQYVWDGGGDGTSWNDAANWDRDEVPATDSLVSFSVDVTVTGTAANNPVGIRIGNKANVVLDLDLTVGNGIAVEHGFTFGDSCTLTLGAAGAARQFTINPEGSRHGMAIFGGSEMVTIVVAEGTNLEMRSGTSGINLANANSTVTNNGSIGFTDGVRDGVRLAGTLINNGTLTGGALGRDLFNVKDGGRLNNTATGTIISDQPGDDGIDLLTGASFLNDGALMLTAKDNASSGNNALVVGDANSAASFVNNGTNVIIDGGGGDGELAGRALAVDTLGTFTNNGVITIRGGAESSRLHVKGTATNGLNAIIDLTDGRFNVATDGNFVNNGLVKTTRDGSGGFVSGTAVNNAFFDYSTSNQFAAGSMGTIVDRGFSLNNNDVRVNAMRSCTIDLVNAPYEWFLDGESYATASDTGAFTFTERSLPADSVVLTTTIPGVEVKVINICQESVQTSGILSPVVRAEHLRVYPNPVSRGGKITLDLSALRVAPVSFRITSVFGNILGEFEVMGGANVQAPLNDLAPGTYFLSATEARQPFLARLVITQ